MHCSLDTVVQPLLRFRDKTGRQKLREGTVRERGSTSQTPMDKIICDEHLTALALCLLEFRRMTGYLPNSGRPG